MGAIASQITSLTIVHWTVYSDADQRKHQGSASLAFVRGIHRWPVNSPHKWSATRKMFPFDDVIMLASTICLCVLWNLARASFDRRSRINSIMQILSWARRDNKYIKLPNPGTHHPPVKSQFVSDIQLPNLWPQHLPVKWQFVTFNYLNCEHIIHQSNDNLFVTFNYLTCEHIIHQSNNNLWHSIPNL